MWNELGQDLSFYHRLRHPTRRESLLGRLRTIASWGWWQLAVHRALHEVVACSRREGGQTLWCRISALLLLPIDLLLKVATKNEIHESSVLEGGVYLSDKGGIVLGARRIGSGTLIHHNVTIGMNPYNRGKPEIGRRVWIGHDSVIFGTISIGDGVTVLPGSVLARSVPPRVVVMGNPARVVMRGFDNRAICSSLADAKVSLPDASLRHHPATRQRTQRTADVR